MPGTERDIAFSQLEVKGLIFNFLIAGPNVNMKKALWSIPFAL
jgi:hypothetical protein